MANSWVEGYSYGFAHDPMLTGVPFNDAYRYMDWLLTVPLVASWLTYPVVYVLPMIGFSGAKAVVAIQVGYCASDIIAKCGVGLIIYSVTAAKSELELRK